MEKDCVRKLETEKTNFNVSLSIYKVVLALEIIDRLTERGEEASILCLFLISRVILFKPGNINEFKQIQPRPNKKN